MNLVVYENGDDILSTIRNSLSDEKIKLSNAKNIDQIHEFHTNQRIDLLLFDIDSYNNTETEYRKIRNDNGFSKIPVIFISSQHKIDELLSYEYALDDFLSKPINPVLLKAKVKNYLTRSNLIVEEYEEKIEKLKDSIKLFFPHEFRTSLSNILGFTNIINKMTNPKNELKKDSINEIHDISTIVLNTTNYLQRISENLILFSNLELMKIGEKIDSEYLNSTQNNTVEIINEAISALTLDNDRRNDIELNLEPFCLNVNDYLFYKIIYELIDNAFKFSTSGTKIIIKTSIKNEFFKFEIQDYGKGMHQKEIKNIGAFRQFDRKLYEQQGIGLGLALAKVITEMYGGNFLILSKKSEGTNIQIALPIINITGNQNE